MRKFYPYWFWLLSPSWLAASLLNTTAAIAAPDITLPSSRPTRWLELRQIQQQVTYQAVQRTPRSAKVGDRLRAVGDKITTAKKSSATLIFDDDIGSVRAIEDTILQVKRLQVGNGGGRITVLSVPRGIARLQVRRFNNPGSQLLIETPAGVAGVRGTTFGVSVTPDGKTVIATEEGSVTATAQGETVTVNPGYYSVIVPGKAPTVPILVAPDKLCACLQVERLEEVEGGKARIVAQVEPYNAVFVEGEAVTTSADGKLDQVVSVPNSGRLSVVVRTPLGEDKTFDLKVSPSPWLLYRQAKFDEAEQLFRQQLQEDTNNTDALLGLGYIAYRRNDLPLAQQRFEQVLAIAPNYVDAQIGLARIALRQVDKDPEFLARVEQILEKQRQAQPDNLDILVFLGYIAERQNNLPLAQQRFEQALNREPNNLDATIGLGIVKLNQQQFVEAKNLFEKAAQLTDDPVRIEEIQRYLQQITEKTGNNP
jgi:cytochrome c-type biogenesis protein CcmH/NrfG